MRDNLRRGVVPAYLLLCLVLGATSATGTLGNIALQLLAIPILFWALISRRERRLDKSERQLLWIAALTVGLIPFQLIPMPPEIWTYLPGRQDIASGYDLLGQPRPWLSLSLAPHETVDAGVGLLPPLAILVAAVFRGYEPRWLVWTVLAVALVSVLLGILQLSSGEARHWRAYEETSDGMTGFFSNSNHLATLLVVCIPFAASLLVRTGPRTQRKGRFPLIPVGVLSVLAVGLVVNPSLAGILLFVPVAVATFLSFSKSLSSRVRALVFLLAMGAAAAVFVAAETGFGDNPIAETMNSAVPRQEAFERTSEALKDFFPAGSGIGTFEQVYRRYEDHRAVDMTFMNHAHNEYLEVILETGVAGGILLIAFLMWWVTRARALVINGTRAPFPQAAMITTAAVMLHSLVDYPLRTTAISALFAIACAMMCRVESGTDSHARGAVRPENSPLHE